MLCIFLNRWVQQQQVFFFLSITTFKTTAFVLDCRLLVNMPLNMIRWTLSDGPFCEKLSLFRYVGENYSNAQEAMEDTMQSFYSQISNQHRLVTPAVGQLVAIRGEDGDELARAQVLEVMAPNKVKVTSLCCL